MKVRTGYRFGAARVAVETDDADASRWLAEFVAPWFEPCTALSAARQVRYTASHTEFESLGCRWAAATTRSFPCFGLDREMVTLAGWTEKGTTVVADSELGSFYSVSATGVEVIARPGFPGARIGLMRVVRELLVGGGQEAGRLLDLHAAAFAAPAGAILLVGPKQAGKTTLLAHFLRCGRASLIANDRVLVDVEPVSPIAFGVPTLVSIRGGTLELFPELRLAPGERPAILHAEERTGIVVPGASHTGPARDFALSPAQLAQRCGAATSRCAPIAAIVFPEVDPALDGWSIEPLANDTGSMRLLDSRYGIHATRRARTIFEDEASGSELTADATPAQIARLSVAAPFFRCRLGRGAYRDSADALLQALVGERALTEPAQ